MAILHALWTFVLSDAGQRLVQNIIAVIAVVFAIRGVRNWNQERRDLRRAELAEKTLATAYRAKDAISSVRSAFGWAGEGSTRQRGENETPDQARALDMAFAPIERLNKVSEIFEEVQSLRYSISAAFSPATATPLAVFLEVRGKIITASHTKMRHVWRNRPMDDAAIDRSEKLDAIIWEGYGEDEEIVPAIDEAIAKLEATFRPYVEASFRVTRPWLRWPNWPK